MSGVLRIVALVALLGGAIALAACGDDGSREEKNAYVREVNAAQEAFAARVTSVSQEITPQSSPARDRRTLERFETAIESVVDQLRAIDVPQDVEAEHEQLVEAMTDFGTEINKATTALRNPDTRSIAEAQRAVTAATQTVNGRIDAAIAAINSKLREA
ncbi:MAG TPA: hypothetical protein VNT54_13195 [Solirubrobacteraceae bacterium]|nr:hypothetical protein [Solirubrobacteraceae bacterium]